MLHVKTKGDYSIMKAKIISLCQLLTALAMCGLLVLAYTGCGGGNDDDDDAYGDYGLQ